MCSQVITRFAPSPTGFLHIGGARTALFNYLFAKHHKGLFYLRIEDTDKTRSSQEAVEAILESMAWLDLKPDGQIVYQSKNESRHVEIAKQLLSEGKAYRCYLTSEELDTLRENARQTGQPIRSPWREKDIHEAPQDQPFVLRLKMPQQGETVLNDLVQGRVSVQNTTLDDMIILRADQTPTYNLSVVVDDHDMGVTHIIRGDDHLNNSFRQIQVYKALEWAIPQMAHIPLIHGTDGAKLSKRHGAMGAHEYKEMGYLPEALNNYLLRLGWSFGDQEIFSRDSSIEAFTLERVGKGPSRFDTTKLDSVNAHYIKEKSLEDLIPFILPNGASNEISERLKKGLPSLQAKAKTLKDLKESAAIYTEAFPLPFTEKAINALDEAGKTIVTELLKRFETFSSENWEEEKIHTVITEYLAEKELKFPKVGQPLRAALTGTTKAPSVTEIMVALGQKESLNRLHSMTQS